MGKVCAEYIVHPFEPLFCADSTTLILGTIPSPASRAAAFYYGHPRNRFWLILSRIYGVPFPQTIDEKISLILENKLALWDVLAGCRISGAEDGSIKDPKPNDFSSLIARTKINRVLCNGQKAYSLYTRFCHKQTGIDAVCLPSTSPANQRQTLDALAAIWKEAVS
ncbi:MAG: DNA-deoxyinosine glycosylase [Spirochaetaceae bacterium]|nr:DNA-deoxyinosine glycosylase [Spirochaetaceae bacterium]